MFLHGFPLHIVFNMVALWFIGAPVEQYLGRVRYLGLYFVSGLAGSAGALAPDAADSRQSARPVRSSGFSAPC